jgi:hypothetical protein
MTQPLSIDSLQVMLRKLDCNSPDCKDKISLLRAMADSACDKGQISRKQWRILYEELAKIQEKHIELQPISCRHALRYGRDVPY